VPATGRGADRLVLQEARKSARSSCRVPEKWASFEMGVSGWIAFRTAT
jgi:hypothetical protein